VRCRGRDQLVVAARRQPVRLRRTIEQVRPFDARHVAAEGLSERQQRLFDEQESGPGIVEDEGQFGRREPDVEGQKDAIGFEHAVVRLEQPVAVGTEERHAVATPRPFCTKSAGQPGGAIGELGVHEALVAANDCQIVGELLGGVAETPNRRKRHVHVVLLSYQLSRGGVERQIWSRLHIALNAYSSMAWDVDFHSQFVPEFEALDEDVQDELLAHAEVLKTFRLLLGRPRVDTLSGRATET
jgi:hypothetical protein